MDINSGDIIGQVLRERGVKFLFTLCGGHISPILAGAKKEGIRVIDVRDEVNAVFAADAVGRLTGVPGVAAVTAGPGVTNSLTALKNAQMAQTPLILLGGAAPTVLKNRGALQDIDQISLVKSIVKMAVTIRRNCDLIPVLESAFDVCRSGTPGPVFIECPIDMLYGESLVRQWYNVESDTGQGGGLRSKLLDFYLKRHVDRMFACNFEEMKPGEDSVTSPDFDDSMVAKALELVAMSQKPVLVVGSQAMLHPEMAQKLAGAVGALGIPVFLTGMARGLLGKSHVLQMRHQRKKALKSADLVILAGMPCDFRLGYGRSFGAGAKSGQPGLDVCVGGRSGRGVLRLDRRRPDRDSAHRRQCCLCACGLQRTRAVGVSRRHESTGIRGSAPARHRRGKAVPRRSARRDRAVAAQRRGLERKAPCRGARVGLRVPARRTGRGSRCTRGRRTLGSDVQVRRATRPRHRRGARRRVRTRRRRPRRTRDTLPANGARIR